MAIILYARVSTVEQTIDHQRAHATAAGFAIDEVVADNGVSGVSTRLTERPEGRRLYDKLRAGDTLVVRWVDRLGRNYEDVCDAIREFMRRGVVIRTVINNFTFDGSTKDPMQQAVRDALIAFMAATAQAQAEATKAAQRAGIEHAKQHGERTYLGRKPSFTRQRVSLPYVVANRPWYMIRAAGGGLMTLGHIVFAWNLWLMRPQPRTFVVTALEPAR